MPETFGKRQRQAVKARKATEREERRVARKQRRDVREAGAEEPFSWLAEAPNHDLGPPGN
jgi:hypothetical protein